MCARRLLGDLFYMGVGFLVTFSFTALAALVFLLRPRESRHAVLFSCKWSISGQLIRKSTILKAVNALVAQVGLCVSGL